MVESGSSILQNLQPFTSHLTRRIRHEKHSWRRKDKFICDILLWPPTHEQSSVYQPTSSYSNSTQILDAVEKTNQERWMVGTGSGRESRNFVLLVWFDDNLYFSLLSCIVFRVCFICFHSYWWFFYDLEIIKKENENIPHGFLLFIHHFDIKSYWNL